MNDQTDSQLLCAYAEDRSEAAFAELVRRHVDFVYSAALRMVCDPHLAEDVTQGAFVALAKSATQLRERQVLAGWLQPTLEKAMTTNAAIINPPNNRNNMLVLLGMLPNRVMKQKPVRSPSARPTRRRPHSLPLCQRAI